MLYDLIFIDDEHGARTAFPFMANWEKCGFNPPVVFSNLTDARRHIENNRVDLIISDIVLNDESGLDFAQEMRIAHPEIIFIFMSGHRSFDFAQKAISVNAFNYLVKPLSFEELEKALTQVRSKLDSDFDFSASDYDDTISKAIKYIKANIKNEEISRSEISEYLGITPQHFSSIFKKHTGTSFINYVTSLKMEYAAELLKNPYYKIYEVRDMCGFKDSNYFTMLFKKHTGFTPAEYRKHFYHIENN